MAATAAYSGLALQALQRVGGPVFEKELRVASRRVRHYVLRTGYAVVLVLLIVIAWNSATRRGSAVIQASRMPEVAKSVTTTVVWLQFLAAQGLAVILLSSAVSEELRKGTLNVLLTTPVTGVQIVVGKLLSRMLQVLVLLAMSLPVLAILRLFGGVPWEFVLAGGCITLTTALWAGSLSLWLSTHCRHGNQAISLTVVLTLFLFVLPSAVLSGLHSWGLLNSYVGFGTVVVRAGNLLSPFHALFEMTTSLWSPGAGRTGTIPSWVWNSLIMLGLASVLLTLTVRRIRTAAMTRMSGEKKTSWMLACSAVGRLLGRRGGKARAARPIRHVKGSPITWKETRRGLLYGWSVSDIVICVLVLAVSIIPMIMSSIAGSEASAALGMFLAWVLAVLVLLRLAAECAGSVPREREARTWPILLTTVLEDRQIVSGKIKAALLRNVPLLAAQAAILLCILVTSLRPETLVYVGWHVLSQSASILLVIGVGSYVGLAIKTRGSAIVTAIVACLMLKYGILWMFLAMGIHAPRSSGVVLAVVAPAVIHVTIAVVAIHAAMQRVRSNVY